MWKSGERVNQRIRADAVDEEALNDAAEYYKSNLGSFRETFGSSACGYRTSTEHQKYISRHILMGDLLVSPFCQPRLTDH
ncbi:hypothetical protein NL676_019535 [Syzygium grande]|nr:hypothetical protein NL676_019535 [Syzygium grande]